MVSLTGHGARRHLGGPHVTLADHAHDVCSLIEIYDLDNITLVGHSYGGRVITQAMATVGQRVQSLVYIDAHTPVVPDTGPTQDRIDLAAENGGMVPFVGYSPDPLLLGGEDGVRWFLERTADQSFACLSAPWQIDLPNNVAKTFIYAAGNTNGRFTQYADAVRNDPAWTYHELDGPHFLMLSHPEELANIVLSA